MTAWWFALLLLATAANADRDRWQPIKTHALLVGVLEWRDPSLAALAKDNRQDRALERQLYDCGVPRANVVFLEDQSATRDRVLDAWRNVCRRAGSGTTLLFYYAGHGTRTHEGAFFAGADADAEHPAETMVAVSALAQIAKGDWRGTRLILLGDCCASGGLQTFVTDPAFTGTYSVASITSATASNESTGTWRFTESIIAGLRGDACVDFDRDGLITIPELGEHVRREMRFREQQLAQASWTKEFARDFVLQRVERDEILAKLDGAFQIHDYVECHRASAWVRARVVRVQDGKQGKRYRVHFLDAEQGVDAEQRVDHWFGASEVRAPVGLAANVGDAVQVEWSGEWLAASIVAVRDDFALVHYAGWDDAWDEWVCAARMKPRAK